MMDRDVITGDRAANAARPECHRRHHSGGVACCAKRAKRIHHNTKDWLLQPKAHDHIFILGMDDERMTAPAVVDELDTALATCLPTVRFVPAQNGCKFFT